MKKVFTTGQVAKICKVAPRTVSKWFDSGRLKGYRIPGSQDRRIPREQLIRFLKEHGMPLGELDIAEHKVTVVSGAPTMWAAWAGLPEIDPMAFRTVRLRGSARRLPGGAGPLPSRSGSACVLSEGYGLTEASPVVTSSAGVNNGRGRSACRCPVSRCASSTPTARTSSSATRASCGCGGPTCSRATGRTTRPPGARSTPTAGCTRATSRWSTTTASCTWWTGRRTSSSCRASTSTRPRSKRCCSSTPPWTRPRWWASRIRSGEAVKAYVVLAARAGRWRRTTSWSSARAPARSLQGPDGRSCSSTSSLRTPRGKVLRARP